MSVSVLGPLDLVLSKLCRFDEGDRQDVDFLIRTQGLRVEQIDAALGRANVPMVFDEVFERSRALLLERMSRANQS